MYSTFHHQKFKSKYSVACFVTPFPLKISHQKSKLSKSLCKSKTIKKNSCAHCFYPSIFLFFFVFYSCSADFLRFRNLKFLRTPWTTYKLCCNQIFTYLFTWESVVGVQGLSSFTPKYKMEILPFFTTSVVK